MRAVVFCFTGFVLLIAVCASLANGDYISAGWLTVLGVGLPMLYKASA